MKRWLVITETISVFSLAIGVQHTRQFRYYRWRWFASLCAFTDSMAPTFGLGMYTRSRVIGRVTKKGK